MLRSKVTFAHFVGVRRSCRGLQFILTVTEAAIATQKPNGKLNFIYLFYTNKQGFFVFLTQIINHGRSNNTRYIAISIIILKVKAWANRTEIELNTPCYYAHFRAASLVLSAQ